MEARICWIFVAIGEIWARCLEHVWSYLWRYLGGIAKVYDEEKDEEYHMKSLLSIVADSAQVEVWTLDTSDIGYLSQKDCKHVYESIIKTKDPDRPMHEQDIQFIIE